MSVPVAARSSTVKVIFDGQSLNYSPSSTNNYRTKLLQGRGIHSRCVAISGFAWTQLKSRIDYRLAHFVARAPVAIVIGMGGTTDYALNNTGAQVYSSESTWADNIRAAAGGTTVYIVQTTTLPNTGLGANTTVASASNGVNTNTFAGSGTLTVVSTTNAPSSGTLKVATSGTEATITYTGTTATTFTGCATTAGGGVLSTGGSVRNRNYQNLYDGNALVIADASDKFDYVVDLAGDSNLADPSNTTYYDVDGVHLKSAGAQVVADLLAPTLDTILSL